MGKKKHTRKNVQTEFKSWVKNHDYKPLRSDLKDPTKSGRVSSIVTQIFEMQQNFSDVKSEKTEIVRIRNNFFGVFLSGLFIDTLEKLEHCKKMDGKMPLEISPIMGKYRNEDDLDVSFLGDTVGVRVMVGDSLNYMKSNFDAIQNLANENSYDHFVKSEHSLPSFSSEIMKNLELCSTNLNLIEKVMTGFSNLIEKKPSQEKINEAIVDIDEKDEEMQKKLDKIENKARKLRDKKKRRVQKYKPEFKRIQTRVKEEALAKARLENFEKSANEKFGQQDSEQKIAQYSMDKKKKLQEE